MFHSRGVSGEAEELDVASGMYRNAHKKNVISSCTVLMMTLSARSCQLALKTQMFAGLFSYISWMSINNEGGWFVRDPQLSVLANAIPIISRAGKAQTGLSFFTSQLT